MEQITLSESDMLDLAALGVEAVVLFGSRATGTASDMSDYDIGVLLSADGHAKRRADYARYRDSMYDIFADRFGDRNGLDLVFLDRAPLELRRHVSKYGRVLMETSRRVVERFNLATDLQYADFEPYRTMLNKAVFEHIRA